MYASLLSAEATTSCGSGPVGAVPSTLSVAASMIATVLSWVAIIFKISYKAECVNQEAITERKPASCVPPSGVGTVLA